VLVEHARTLAGITDAVHAEYGRPGTAVVSTLACALVDTDVTVELADGSRLQAIYARPRVVERATCRYGLDPSFEAIAGEHGLRVAARDDTGEVRAVERTDHPFFVATLFQPQLRSTPQQPHPIWLAFVDAVAARAGAAHSGAL
jgi:CTP synthase (UTP-ammonia lyase)